MNPGDLRSSLILSEARELIRKMSLANPLWGAPRIHGELLKLGIEVSQATVAKYMARPRRPPSQTWRTFLNKHVKQLVSTDFFVLPTVTFRVLYVFVVLAHDRRRLLHFNVTAHPTSEWTAQQLVEAFPWGNTPRYLLDDRDSISGLLTWRKNLCNVGCLTYRCPKGNTVNSRRRKPTETETHKTIPALAGPDYGKVNPFRPSGVGVRGWASPLERSARGS